MKSWYILLWVTPSHISNPFQNTYAQFYVPSEQINKCMPIFKFAKKSLYRWSFVGTYYYENITKRWKNILALMARIGTFLMTTYKLVFLDNFFGDFLSCNCRSSVRMSVIKFNHIFNFFYFFIYNKNLYIKDTQRNMKMCLLWAVVLYIQVKIVCIFQ